MHQSRAIVLMMDLHLRTAGVNHWEEIPNCLGKHNSQRREGIELKSSTFCVLKLAYDPTVGQCRVVMRRFTMVDDCSPNVTGGPGDNRSGRGRNVHRSDPTTPVPGSSLGQ